MQTTGNFFYGHAYSLEREVVNMVIKINNKPIQVKEDNEHKIDWLYLAVTCVGYGLIIWIIRLAAITFLGAWM